MEQTWRWFGPQDPVTLAHAKQAGATGIVSALHDIPRGEVWPLDAVLAHKALIEAAGLRWSVVESIPVHDAIKSGRGPVQRLTEHYQDSIRACARAGLRTVCYNFMSVVDWTRTDLNHHLPSTGTALRFDLVDFVAYDVFVLRRPRAEGDYRPELVARAEARAAAMSEARRAELERTVIAGLPGGDAAYSRAALAAAVTAFEGLGTDDVRQNLARFLRAIVPVAEEVGVRLGIHPDDPPFPLFGLPRVVSTAADVEHLLAAVDSSANGLTFCVGSFGARPDNDLPAMVAAFAPRIHFAHLRNVTLEQEEGCFHEAEHLGGSADMVGIVAALLAEERRRAAEGEAEPEIPLRPDHGHLLGDEIGGGAVNPGYSFVGRLKGLAELRGVMAGLAHRSAAENRIH